MSSLEIRGTFDPARRAVAIVGARAARRGSLDRAHALGEEAARAGLVVVSGGAFGVDAAAHEGALAGGGTTVVVLGSGIDVAYPERHAPLFDRVVASGGALVSPFARGEPPKRHNFLRRNTVIAQLAELTIVVEASLRSGSLSTAAAARKLGRPVAAFRGSEGCAWLIERGAREIFSPRDLPDLLAGRTPREECSLPVGDAGALLACATGQPTDLGTLAARAGISIAACAARLIDLEVAGFMRRTAGGLYLRSR